MRSRRWIEGGIAAAALLPSLFWLSPALLARSAPSFRDQGDFFYPLKLYTAARLRLGELPLWNPLSGAGEPWLANAQSGVFYPPTLFFLLPSQALAAGLFLLLHFAVGALGMRFFLKGEGASGTAASFGAAVFAGGGFAASLSAYWNHFGAAMYLPAVALFARKCSRSRAATLGLGAVLGLQAMAGSPELLGAGVLIAFLFAFPREASSGDGWQEVPRFSGLRRCAAATVLALALAAWVLVPLAELAFHSDRRGPLPTVEREIGTVAGPDLASAVGLASEGSGAYLASLYFGPLPLLAALAMLAERQRRPFVLLLGLVALAGVLLALAPPPGAWLRSIPPFDRFRYPAKGLAVTVFAIAAMAGFGADTLRFAPLTRRALLVLPLAGLAALGLLLFSPMGLPVQVASAVGILLLLSLLLLRGPAPGAAAWAQAAATLALVVSLGMASRGLFRFAPEAMVARIPPSVGFLAGVPGRVLTPPMGALAVWAVRDARFGPETLHRQRESLLGYTNLLSGTRTVRTAAALPTAAARRIAETIDSDPDLARVARPVSARLLWTPFPPAGLGSRKVGDFYRAPLNPYRPRLSFVTRYRVEPDPLRAWERASRGVVNPATEVLLDREPALRPTASPAKGLLIARIAEDLPERVVADVTTGSAGLLVLTDLAYPGWVAEEGEVRLDLLRADGFFRAVALPAGSHRVTFRYRPLSFYVGSAISLAALLVTLFLLFRGEPIPIGRRG